MKPGQASKTAVMVCMGRAVADGLSLTPRYSDPTAMAMLSEESQRLVELARSPAKPKNFKLAVRLGFMRKQSRVMAVRTVEIDDAVREAAAPQVVILGAGLDGRAWRMPELANATVFEVDHPDSQREKRARVGSLPQKARDVKFVPVDFERDDLDTALTAAGHDPSKPTTWVWEGVVMYLALPAIEATMAIVAKRSAPGSRLVILYVRPALRVAIVNLVTSRMGEPMRSKFKADEMRALLGRYRFEVARDRDAGEIGAAISAELGREARVAKHLAVVVADRVPA